MTRRILVLILILFLVPSLARAQGQQITAGPFSNSGLLYVCPVPSGGTPCPSPVSIFSNITLTTGISNPIVVFAQQTYTFYVAGGQYTLEMPASGIQQIVGGGSSASSLGAAINVKSAPYLAVGNGKHFIDGATSGANNNITSSQATFTASDVNQKMTCSSAGALNLSNVTITAFVNSSTLTYSGANPGVLSGLACSLTNPADPAAILSAFNACKTTFNGAQAGTTFQNAPCSVYIPAGIYGISNQLNNLISTGNEGCVPIIGDGMAVTILAPTGNLTYSNTLHGALINDHCNNAYLRDFSFEMGFLPTPGGGTLNGIIAVGASNSLVENVGVLDECVTSGTMYGIAGFSGTNQVWIRPYVVTGGSCGGVQGGLQLNNVSQAVVYSPFLSNSQSNLNISNATSGANGSGIVFYGGVIDEGSITTVQNSVDVWFNGTTLTGGANCLSVDATSFVWLTGGYCGTFGGGTGGGPTVASGGVLNMTQVHVNAVNAGSSCYTSATYGGIVDDGTNRCTTSGGGTVYPSGGVVNKTSLSHLPFNAFQTGTLATTTNLQTFVVDQPVQIQTFSWTPNNAFACTAGSFPTFSMSDGTNTVTTAATDTSANGTVTHTFANTTAAILNPSGTVGAILTVKVVTTGTCGTAPTNVNINVWGQATAPGV